MACGPCARKRLKQQATSLQVAAQQEAERQAQINAEALAVRVAETAVSTVSSEPVVVEEPAPKTTRKPKSRG